jgi:hypothetical protein
MSSSFDDDDYDDYEDYDDYGSHDEEGEGEGDRAEGAATHHKNKGRRRRPHRKSLTSDYVNAKREQELDKKEDLMKPPPTKARKLRQDIKDLKLGLVPSPREKIAQVCDSSTS